jgi:DNA mismatch repair protein MutS
MTKCRMAANAGLPVDLIEIEREACLSIEIGARRAEKCAMDRAAAPFDESKYRKIKAANPDSLLLCRMGDFYEFFFDDAQIAAKALKIDLTKRGGPQGDDVPMCGVPFERAQDYLWMLISLGHRVSVWERREDSVSA